MKTQTNYYPELKSVVLHILFIFFFFLGITGLASYSITYSVEDLWFSVGFFTISAYFFILPK